MLLRTIFMQILAILFCNIDLRLPDLYLLKLPLRFCLHYELQLYIYAGA